MKAMKFDDQVISVEDAQSGYMFHFAVGPTKGFRYLGVQTDPPQPTPPPINPLVFASAEATARNYAKSEGWL